MHRDVPQIGCGKSFLASEDSAPRLEEYSVDLFLEELGVVKHALGLTRHHVMGHGWGGMLALAALAKSTAEEKESVASLALASTPPSYQSLVQDRQKRVRDRHCHSDELTISGSEACSGRTASTFMTKN